MAKDIAYTKFMPYRTKLFNLFGLLLGGWKCFDWRQLDLNKARFGLVLDIGHFAGLLERIGGVVKLGLKWLLAQQTLAGLLARYLAYRLLPLVVRGQIAQHSR